ncbi:Caltractin, partial [Symbiodinium sp. KB8]
MEVDDRDIGRIVGRGGCNIRDLQEGTKCKIITPNKRGDNDDPSLRKVLIQGSKEQIAKCKEAINGVLMGEEPKDVLAQIDGAVIIKNIEPMSMGHLAKIKSKIEEEMKVRIELDARSARIWGNDNDHDKALNAKERIEEEMEDITTVDTCTVSVPAHLVNQVINDSALRQLQDQTGLTANVCKNDQGTGIRLTGLAGAITEAKQLIERRGAGEGAEFLALMPGLFSKMPPKAYSDFQRDVSFLMQNTGAQVTLSEGSNRADFRGGPDEVRHAKAELQKILHFYFPQECDTIDLPPESVDWIAGDDDRELMRLQSAGAVIALDRGAATMWLCGNPRSVEQVRNRVRNSLQRWDREHAVIQLPSRESAWAIIGKGGSTIRELQTSTQARIDVDPDNQRVTISGKEDIL